MATNRPGYNKEYYLREKAKIIASLGGCCAHCQATEEIEIHHIVPCLKGKGRGMLARLVDWRRQLAKGNLKLLCIECHKDQDHYHLVKTERSIRTNQPLAGVS